MNLRDLLTADAASLPRPPRITPFGDALAELFGHYLALVNNVDATDEASKAVRAAIPEIERLCASILKVLDLSLLGQPSRAGDALDTAIKGVAAHLDKLVSV